MAGEAPNAATAVVSEDKASQTLSQFIARVLNQLALSAWLPAAALVLSVIYVFQLAGVLEESSPEPSPLQALGLAGQRIGETNIGGAVVIIAAVVVLTLVTQAFTFESIRVLEGYWGTLAPWEWLAGKRREHFAKRRQSLDERYAALTDQAWDSARKVFHDRQTAIQARGLPAAAQRREAIYTPNVLALVEARVKAHEPTFKPTPWERTAARSIKWESAADPEALRRRVNVDKVRCDFPDPLRALPTRVGNILKAHEDATEQPDIESFVQRVFDDLPPSLQVEHDEQRTRLDLYCSMVFVSVLVAAVAACRLAPHGLAWAVGGAIVGLVLAGLMYRAAMASARAYGNVLEIVALNVKERVARESEHS